MILGIRQRQGYECGYMLAGSHIDRHFPERARSCSPAIPSASNRRRQSITVFGRTFKLSATVLTGFPSSFHF